jgi:hypothetical protein
MMVGRHHGSGAAYRAQLADVMRRAAELEQRAQREQTILDPADPQYASWVRIERRYATIRGNALHLLVVHQRNDRRSHQPLTLIRRYLHLF